MSRRTCVRNACSNPACTCIACTPRPFNPKRKPTIPPVCTCTLSDSPAHELVDIEEVWVKEGIKYRWRCKCGAIGIPVGSAAIDGQDWARGAFDKHKGRIDYDHKPEAKP